MTRNFWKENRSHSCQLLSDTDVYHDDSLLLLQLFAQLVCSFRYGREEDETMGLNFRKELTLSDEPVYPPPKQSSQLSRFNKSDMMPTTQVLLKRRLLS